MNDRTDLQSAHDTLVQMSAEIGWATDGDISTAVRHVQELVRRRDEEIDRLNMLLYSISEIIAGDV